MNLRPALAAALILAVAACAADGDSATTGTTDGDSATPTVTVAVTTAPTEPASTDPPAAATTEPAEAGPPDDWRSASQVWFEIQASSDCAALQTMFDTAADNHDRESDRNNLPGMEMTTQIMGEVDERMQDIDCY